MEKLKNLTKNKVIALVAALLLVVGGAIAAIAIGFGNSQVVPSEDKYGYVNPDETKAEPDDGFTIDGVLDEEEYANCDWLKLQNNQGGAGVDMAMTSFYGEKGLYIVYDITENSPIYVNLDRESYMNSGIEMYLALNDVADMNSNSIFEIDLLPTGDMNFRQRTGKDNWVNVASSDEIMAYLGATTKGGPVNTEECNGYVLELYIPWEYMDKLGMDVLQMKENFIYINPVHITSYNLTGTESGTDRYWYSFATQLGGDGWNDVAQYFRFGADGVLGIVPVELIPGANYTITGNDSVIPGMMSTVQITPDEGYTLNSILVNGEEYIKKVSYNKDGSVTLTLRGEKEGLKISASAEAVTDGNKTLSGLVAVHKLGGDSLEGVSVSYKGPTGEKPITFDKNGKFEISNLKPGYYTITVEKKGYAPINRGIYLYRDIETDLILEYEMFKSETGYNWILDDQNDGVLNRFGGSGKILSVDSYDKFEVKANLKYDTKLAEMSNANTFEQQRSGIQIKFSNGKYWRVNLMKENGVYKVQYAKHSEATVFNWKTVHELTEEEIALYQSANGITLSIMRDGNYAWVCLNGKPVAIEILDEEYKNCTAQIGFEGWIANQEIEEMTYNISSNFNQNLKDFYVTTSDKWDISRQHEGILLLSGGGTHALKFQKQYMNFDFTLKNVKENDTTGNKPGRTDILLEFDTDGDGKADKSVSFGIVCTDTATNTCWIQTLGNADNYIPETRIKGLYKLNASETEKYLSGEGVELRVVRKGTEVYVFLDEQEVAIWDLTQNNSGVTADTKVELSLRHYDAEGDVELGFALSEDVGDIEINKIFKDNEKWDLSKQLQGIVSLPGGGTDTSLQFLKKYQNIDLTVTAKENDTTGKQFGRTDILFEFDLNNDGTMDKNVSFGIVQMSDGSCQVQTLGWDQKFIPEKRINALYELDYAETLKYKKEGIDLRVVRYETTAYIYIEDKQIAVFDLAQNNSGVKADTNATVILRHYDAVADNVVIPFKVTEEVKKPEIVKLPDTIFKNNYRWELSKQWNGMIVLPEGGDGGKLEFMNPYKNFDIKLNVRDYDDEGNAAARTDVLFVFENGAHVSFGITSDAERAWIQSMNNGPDDDKQIYNRWSGHGNMTAEELEKYKADGVELRIVRVGTDALLYINGRQVKVANLTNNNSGVTADMLATVYIRHYDDKGEYVEIPYSITDQIETVTIKDNSQGGKIGTDKKVYLIGDTVVLCGQSEGVYVSSLKVNGDKVTLDDNGTYTFKATEKSYELEGTFRKAVFKPNIAWDLLNQNQGTVTINGIDAIEGIASLPGGKSNTVTFYDQYIDMDLTVLAKENAAEGAAKGRTDVLFEFENGKNISFGVVCVNAETGHYAVQVLNKANDTDNAGNIIYNRWKEFHRLSQEEIDKYNDEGIEFRIVRTGTVVYLFLDGKQVAVCDLTNNNSGVTDATKATVSLRHYDAVAEQVDIPFTVANQVSRVTITDNSQNGEVITENSSYVIGTEIVLKSKAEGYYLTGLKVDGEAVTLNDDGTYKFIATKATYTVEGTFTEAVFVDNPNWNLKEQNQGTEEVNYTSAIKGVVTLPNGGNAYNTSNLGGLTFKDQYTDIDLNLIVRDYDDSAYTYARTDVLFEFEGGETVTFGVTKTGAAGDEANWTYRVQSMGCTLNNWKTLRDMSDDEIALYTSDSGINFRILRSGTKFYVYLDGKLAKGYDFASKITKDTKATVTIRHYDDAGVQVDIPFTVADEVGNIFTTQGTWGGTWDISNQFGGTISVNQTGGNTGINFANKYTDMDLSLKVKENGTSSKPGRTDVMLEFENGKNVSFGVLCTDKANGKYFIQTLNKANDTSNAGKIIFNRGIGFYQLTAEEAAKYEGDGLDFRMIRQGTVVYLFIDGKQVAECDLTTNNSGVTADMEATVTLRHYDVTGTIEFPFAISDVVEETTVSIESNEYGTITKNQVYRNGNRTTLYDITKHFVGEKIALTMTPVQGYALTGLEINNVSVIQDVNTGESIATYIMEAAKNANTVAGYFDTAPVFKNNYNGTIWDVSKQFEGIVSLPNGGGGTNNPLQFFKTFGDVKATLLVRDYPYAGTANEDARTELGFEFANGETVQFGVVKTGGLYRIQTRKGTLLDWKTPYFIEDQSIIDSYVVTEEELSQGNPGGLEFSVVRKGTEFYLYLGDEMVKGYDFSYKISSDTKVNVFIRHYDDQGGNVEIPFTITEDFTIAQEDIRLFAEKEEVTDYAYSFAVIPDPQIVTENDVTKGQTYLTKMFDWIIANKDSKKIQYVFNLGDITQNNNDAEWTLAAEQHARLTAAGIAYSAVRGNHDLSWYGKTEGADDYYDDEYTAYMGTDAYRAQFGGFYSEDNISNSWRTFEVGSMKYLMLTMDYGPSDAVLEWASDVIEQHPAHNVIITTHAYLYRDGTTLDAEDNVPPSTSGGNNDGDDMWEKLVSKHENIVLVMSGHDPSENIVVNKSTGDNGNVVTSMLIDAQDAEKDEGSMAMVALLHFSEDGKNIQVEYYSTAKEKYFKSQNQFSTELDVVEEGEAVYGTGYVPVSGQTVKTSSEYASFPRTIEVTFNRNSSSARQILFGNCKEGWTDFVNLEIPANEDIIYFNSTIGGTVFRHSFNSVTIPENETVRITVVIEDAAMKLYVNGVLKQTRTNANSSGPTVDALVAKIPSANLPDSFAVGNDLRSYYFDGTIYDVAVWSDARTAEEVAGTTISDLNTDSYKADLLAAYNFRAVYNANAENPFHADLSDNGYDLTGTLNVGTSTIAPVGAYTTISVEKGNAYSTTISDEQRVTLSDTPYTLSTWIHVTTSVTNEAGAILGNYSGSYANALNFEIHKNGNPRLYHRNESNVYDSLIFTDVDIRSDKEWVHLAFTISGNKVSCYVNGELKQTLVAANTIQLESTNKDYVIGGDLRGGNGRAFLGRILSLDLYDAILSEDKIKRLYMEGREAISEGKIIY